jgi:molecular chaperone GrpE
METKKEDIENVNEEVVLEEDKEIESKTTDEELSKKEKKDKNKVHIIELETQIKELKLSLARVQADTQNYKKRLELENVENRKYANQNLLQDLIEPLNQLNTVVSYSIDNDLLNNFLIGFKMINDKIFEVLETSGVKKIDALGKKFDSRYHEAIEKAYDPAIEENVIVSEISFGYMYKDRVLKHSLVKVNVKPVVINENPTENIKIKENKKEEKGE